MKKRRLNKRGKLLVTILVVILSIAIYLTTGVVGELAQDNRLWLVVCFAQWVYLFFIQFCIYNLIWEN